MKAKSINQAHISAAGLNKLISRTKSEDIIIDIFCESMREYIQKLNKVSAGKYELDHYDTQVLSIAGDQCI